jgi:hypothetical protein
VLIIEFCCDCETETGGDAELVALALDIIPFPKEVIEVKTNVVINLNF